MAPRGIESVIASPIRVTFENGKVVEFEFDGILEAVNRDDYSIEYALVGETKVVDEGGDFNAAKVSEFLNGIEVKDD